MLNPTDDELAIWWGEDVFLYHVLLDTYGVLTIVNVLLINLVKVLLTLFVLPLWNGMIFVKVVR